MKKKKTLINLISAVAILAILCFAFLKKPGKIEGFENEVTTIDGMEIPDGVRIVALGEATHGNREFQELKLEVFRELVEKTDIRALVLEGEFGGCALVNEYIQGGDGTEKDMAAHLGYRIYRTDQMCELIRWMREYNMTASEDDRVRLYGMDCQDDIDCMEVIDRFYEKVDGTKHDKYSAKMKELLGDSWDAYDVSKFDEIYALMDEIKNDIMDNKDGYSVLTSNEQTQIAEAAAVNIINYFDLMEKENGSNRFRDTKMKENVDLILGLEENEHDGGLMIACHNGHMTENQSSNATFLGVFLNEEYGDSYYTIGTDFYYSTDNLPNGSVRNRITETFCSDDPIAYQLKDMPEEKYYIDFAKVDKDSPLGKKINGRMKTGSLGEGYNKLMKFIKKSYQLNFAPVDMYDAMIVYYEVNPTEIYTD